jgi:hypothetical protein
VPARRLPCRHGDDVVTNFEGGRPHRRQQRLQDGARRRRHLLLGDGWSVRVLDADLA